MSEVGAGAGPNYKGAGVLIEYTNAFLLGKEGKWVTDYFKGFTLKEEASKLFDGVDVDTEKATIEVLEDLQYCSQTDYTELRAKNEFNKRAKALSDVLELFLKTVDDYKREKKNLKDVFTIFKESEWLKDPIKAYNEIKNNTRVQFTQIQDYTRKGNNQKVWRTRFVIKNPEEMYGIPKGNIESSDDDSKYTAQRELEEETGYKIHKNDMNYLCKTNDYVIYKTTIDADSKEKIESSISDQKDNLYSELFDTKFIKATISLPSKSNAITREALKAYSTQKLDERKAKTGGGTRRRKSFRKKTLHKKH